MTYNGSIAKLSVYADDGCYMISEMPGYTLEQIRTSEVHFGSFYWGPASGLDGRRIDGVSALYRPQI